MKAVEERKLFLNTCVPVANYTKFAAQITINLITTKKKFEETYYNLIKPFTARLWGVTFVTVMLALSVSQTYHHFPTK